MNCAGRGQKLSLCNTLMAVIGKGGCEELRVIPAKVERIQYAQEVLDCPECKKDGPSVIFGAKTLSPFLKHSLASLSAVARVMYQKYMNSAENIARPYAVRRKNYLFHDTITGARASSIIYSLVETAKLNNLNIYAYLEAVLLYMPDYKNEPEGIEEVMPWSDMIQQRCRIRLKS